MTSTMKRVIANLQRNHMQGYLVENRQDLLSLLQKLIPLGASIGCGDSVTLEETGVFSLLQEGNYQFYDKHNPLLTKEQKRELYSKNFGADIFITSSNAVTEDGKIFNIDGNGSRVAPMLYGPRQVLIVVGKNKIVPTIAEAITRTRQIAAPLDAKRLQKTTPCTITGKCHDCHHPQRICNDFVCIAGQFDEERITVIIVNEELGY